MLRRQEFLRLQRQYTLLVSRKKHQQGLRILSEAMQMAFSAGANDEKHGFACFS
jgi:hypothetical protein